jgi:hypothetical protein
MTEPAFNGAGRVEGKELWRIENLKPVQLPKVRINNLYKIISYLNIYINNIKYIKYIF